MNQKTQALWLQLREAGLVTGDLPAMQDASSPWYIKVLLGFSGWLAALFLMGFLAVGMEFILREAAASLVVGLLMIGGAYGLLRIPKNEFVEHLALAVSLAGQGWVVFSFFELFRGDIASIWLLIGLIQLVLAGLMPNFIHRVFSSFGAALAFSIALIYLNVPYVFSSVILLVASWLWLHEFRYPQHLQKIHAIGYGLVITLILVKGTSVFGHELLMWRYRYSDTLPWITPWMGEALTGIATLWVIWQLLQRYFSDMTQRAPLLILAGMFVLCVVSLEARGVSVGLVILLLGFANSNRVLMGLGVVSLLFYISSYYYLLDTSLLHKSFSLLIIGAVLLAWRWSMLRYLPVAQEKNHE